MCFLLIISSVFFDYYNFVIFFEIFVFKEMVDNLIWGWIFYRKKINILKIGRLKFIDKNK